MISWRLGVAFTTLAAAILILVAGSVHFIFEFIETRLVEVGDAQTVQRVIPLGEAREAEVELLLAISDLVVSGGATALMEAQTSHYVPPLYTTTQYSVTEQSGRLFFAHANPDIVPNFERPPEFQSVGIVKLNNSVPLSLTLALGIHQGRLQLADLNLRHLYVTVVDGSCEIDLRDDWQNSFEIEIDNAFGESVILLPAESGVRVRFEDEIEGTIAMKGLKEKAGFYVNEAFGVSPVTLDVMVSGEQGRVRLIVDSSEPTPR
jgi:hypothetical protein